MSRVISNALVLGAALSLFACGGGSSSGGGGQFAKECVEGEQNQNFDTVFTNSCSFEVTVRKLSKDAHTGELDPPFNIAPNSSVIRDELVLLFGACRSPSVPEPENGFQFKCS
jgi:hypothetical protein